LGAEAVEQQAPIARFCTACGTELDLPSGDCPRCAVVETALRAHAEATAATPGSISPFADVIGLYAVLLISFLPIIVGVWSTRVGETLPVGYEIVVTVIDALIVGFWAMSRGRTIAPLIVQPVAVGWLAFAATLAPVTFGIAHVFVTALNGALGLEEIQVTPGFVDAGYGWAVIVLVVCVQPAIIEELAFRGIIFNGLLSFLSRTETIVVSSFMFMLIHIGMLGVPQLVLGIILAWMRLRTGSLLPCMILHFTHNFLVVLSEMR